MVLRRKARVMSVVLALAIAVALMAPAAASAGKGEAPRRLQVTLPDSSAGGCLKLLWEVENPAGVTAYRVYRSEKPDPGFRLVASSDVHMTCGNRMDHTDTGLRDGSTYYYKVALVGADGRETGTTPVVPGTLPPKPEPKPGGYMGKHIIISIADQTIYFLEDEVLVKSHLCSTGVDSHPTLGGVFSVLDHQYCAISETYGGVYLYYWMGFAPDTGMHAIPYDPKSGSWTGGDDLGHKASHGCVRQSLADAKWAYGWAPNKTRVDVIGSHYEPPPPKPAPPPAIKGGHAAQGISQASTTWYLAEGSTMEGFDEYVACMNPNPNPASVTADYMKPDGTLLTDDFTINPFSRYTIHVNEVPGLGETDVSIRLTSDQVIIADRSMYFDYHGKLGGSCSTGVNAPDTMWYLAEGYTGGDFDEFILVQNPGDKDGTVQVNFMRPDGSNLKRSYYGKARSRLSIHVDDIPELANAEVSAMVNCDQPVVVERAQYFNYYGRDDGNTSNGITTPSTTWYLAEGFTGNEFDEYVLMQNPSDQNATAHVTFMRSDGKNIVKDYPLLPRSRFSIHVDDIPELAFAEVSTVIESDVPIISERSMYFVSYGRPGGSTAPGVPAPARYWYLAEGNTGGEFDTYIPIMNPNQEKVKVDVNFLQPNGSIMARNYTVPAHSRYTIHVDEIKGLTDAQFSTSLTGAMPIICERAMYFSIPRK